MQVNIIEPINLFAEAKQYIVPTFQRAYAWSREDQWELLFDDVERVALEIDGIRSDDSLSTDEKTNLENLVPKHFLGAVVLETKAAGMNAPQTWLVVDGQQRISTLQLLLRGLLSALRETGDESNATKLVEKLIFNDEDLHPGDYRFRLIPRRPDLDVWRELMLSNNPAAGLHIYNEAEEFFEDKSTQFLKEHSASSLVDAIKSKLSLVVIELDNKDDSQLIFEVLNGRQTPLTAADLLKNLLFMNIESTPGVDVQKVYEQYWAPLDDPWWNALVGIGQAQRGRRDHMISAWLSIRLNKDVKVSKLYNEARAYLSSQNAVEAIEDISEFSKTYRQLFEDASSTDSIYTIPRESLAHRRILDDFGVMTCLPLLMFLKSEAGAVDKKDYLDSVLVLESWIVRRAVMRWQTRNYGTIFQGVLSDLALADPSLPKTPLLVEAFENRAESYRAPTDAELNSYFKNTPVYGNGMIGANRLRIFLGAIDHYLEHQDKRGVKFNANYEELTVEHLMPQKWEANWPLDSSLEDIEEAAEKRKTLIQTFGNLTLLTQSLNSSVSNSSWEVKKNGSLEDAGILQQTKLHITQEVIDHEVWNEDLIIQRSSRLAEIFIKVWPTFVTSDNNSD